MGANWAVFDDVANCFLGDAIFTWSSVPEFSPLHYRSKASHFCSQRLSAVHCLCGSFEAHDTIWIFYVTLQSECSCWQSLFFPVCPELGFLWNVSQYVKGEPRDLRLAHDRLWVMIWHGLFGKESRLDRLVLVPVGRCRKGWAVDCLRLVPGSKISLMLVFWHGYFYTCPVRSIPQNCRRFTVSGWLLHMQCSHVGGPRRCVMWSLCGIV